MEFRFEVYGDRLIHRKLLRIGDRVEDMGPAFDQAALQMMGMEEKLFDSEGASSGRPWAALKPITIERKLREGLDVRTLHATLALRRSLTQPGAPFQVLVAGHDRLTFGTALPYAARHQRPKSGTRRRPLDFSEGDKQQLIKGLQRYTLTGQLERRLA